MARVTISLPENLAAAAERQAQAERRSTSAYVALLIEADVRSKGLLDSGDDAFADVVQKLRAAAAVSPEIVGKVEETIRREMRADRSGVEEQPVTAATS